MVDDVVFSLRKIMVLNTIYTIYLLGSWQVYIYCGIGDFGLQKYARFKGTFAFYAWNRKTSFTYTNVIHVNFICETHYYVKVTIFI